MQQKWDDLDKIIANSFEMVDVDENYNKRLLKKIDSKKHESSQRYTFAFSLIFAGFLLMFIYTSNFQYKIYDIQCKIKTNIMSIRLNNDYFKNIFGE